MGFRFCIFYKIVLHYFVHMGKYVNHRHGLKTTSTLYQYLTIHPILNDPLRGTLMTEFFFGVMSLILNKNIYTACHRQPTHMFE